MIVFASGLFVVGFAVGWWFLYRTTVLPARYTAYNSTLVGLAFFGFAFLARNFLGFPGIEQGLAAGVLWVVYVAGMVTGLVAHRRHALRLPS